MNKYDGWTENRLPGAPDYNEGDSVAVRGQLQWEPSDAARILLSGNYSDNDAAVGAWQHQATTPRRERRERAAGTERDDWSDRLQCGSRAGRRRSAYRHRLLRVSGHGRRSVGRRLRPRRARRDRGLRRIAQHRLGRRRRHDHLDHGLPEGRAPAVRGHRRGPLPADPADVRRGNEDFHAGAARGRRQRRVPLAGRRLLLRQRGRRSLPARPDQSRVRVLRRRLHAEQRVARRVRPARVRPVGPVHAYRGSALVERGEGARLPEHRRIGSLRSL